MSKRSVKKSLSDRKFEFYVKNLENYQNIKENVKMFLIIEKVIYR